MSDETWGTEELRITLFREPTEAGHGTWQGLTGEPPVTQNSSPRTHTYHEDGEILGGLLAVDVTPERVDVRHSALVSGNAQPTTPSLGPFDAACTPLRELCSNWLGSQTFTVRRVALGVVARLPVANQAAGYERIAEFLPAVRISTASSDFFYQINRRRPSAKVSGLAINRLSRWSVQRTQLASLSVGLASAVATTVFGEPSHSCRAELDINTIAEYPSPLSGEMVISLLVELQSLASELLRDGDVE